MLRRLMLKKRDFLGIAVGATIAACAIAATGCAPVPAGGQGHMRGPGGMQESRREDLPARSFLLVRATIVDLTPARGTMTVKDDQTHGTWTVAVTGETRIVGPGGSIVGLGDLQVGEKVQIRGYSRIEEFLTALEIERKLDGQ